MLLMATFPLKHVTDGYLPTQLCYWWLPSHSKCIFNFKNHIFANNSKTAGFRPFSSIFNPPNPILPPSDLATTKLLRKFQTPTTPGGRDSSPSVRLSVRSDFSVPLWARMLKFRTKDAYATVSRRVKWFFDRTTLRPTIGPRVASKVGRSLSAAISQYPQGLESWNFVRRMLMRPTPGV